MKALDIGSVKTNGNFISGLTSLESLHTSRKFKESNLRNLDLKTLNCRQTNFTGKYVSKLKNLAEYHQFKPILGKTVTNLLVRFFINIACSPNICTVKMLQNFSRLVAFEVYNHCRPNSSGDPKIIQTLIFRGLEECRDVFADRVVVHEKMQIFVDYYGVLCEF